MSHLNFISTVHNAQVLGSTAADIFLIVASICIVLVTIMVGVAMYVVVKAALRARTLIELLHGEAQLLIDGRRRIRYSTRFALRWLRAFFRDE